MTHIDSGDRPATELLEIEITPEMTEAGESVLRYYAHSDGIALFQFPNVVRDIYRIMNHAFNNAVVLNCDGRVAKSVVEATD